MSEDVELNIKGLEKLIRSLKGKMPVARVGILGQNAVRGSGTSSATPNNATIGAWHEFGTSKLPQRSFLRIPLTEQLDKQLQKSGQLDRETLEEIVAQGTFVPWLKKVAVIAESVVLGAFDSGGYGQWRGWSRGYSNKSGQILVDTQQLRNSITSEVKE